MPADQIPALARGLVALYLCVLAPGQAWWRGRGSSLPRPFAQVLVSVIVTTLLATALAAFGTFSLALVVLGNACVALAGFLYQLQVRGHGDHIRIWRDRVGPALFALALLAYWPPYPSFIVANDASVYLQAGASLARTGSLAVRDELGPALSPTLREGLFDSMSQVVGGGGPPYRRMPGSLLLNSLDDTHAWPAFFPVPIALSALATEAFGAGAAPGFATLFAALAVWSTFVLTRRWLDLPWALLATALVAANGAACFGARLPMSEPIAWYFLWAGLCAMAAYEQEGWFADAVLGAAALGAAVLTRIDTGIYLVVALALLAASRAPLRQSLARALPPAFFAMLGAWMLLTLAELSLVPGGFAAPLIDSVKNARLLLFWITVNHPWAGAACALSGAAAAALAMRMFGFRRTIALGAVAGLLVAHSAASNFLPARTPMWLSFYAGWPALLLAAAGVLALWPQRRSLPGLSFFLATTIAVALVLFYNPHVYPGLPWGMRRYVPLLLPALLVIAVLACALITQRSRAAGLVAAALLVAGVVPGMRPMWGKPFYDGVTEQLQTLHETIPGDGIILINRTLGSHMLGSALWLMYGRNNLVVFPDTTRLGRSQITAVAYEFPDKPVYFVTGGVSKPSLTPFVRATEIARTSLKFLVSKVTSTQRPDAAENYLTPIAIYRIDRVVLPTPSS